MKIVRNRTKNPTRLVRLAMAFANTRHWIAKIGFSSAMRYRVAQLLGWTCVTLIINGAKVRLRMSGPDIHVAITSLGEEFSALHDYLPESFDGIVLDAGGFIGTAALKFSTMFPNATIVTVEPSRDNFSLLERNVSNVESIISINAALVPVANGKLKLLNRGTGAWGYTVVAPKDNPLAEAIDEVDTISLEQIHKRFNRPIGVIKLDIEGAEKAILNSSCPVLERSEIVVAELHDRIIEGCTDAFMKFSIGREVVDLGGRNSLA